MKPSNQTARFNFVAGYKGMAEYAHAVRLAENADLDALYNKYVVTPYWRDFLEGSEFRENVQHMIAKPIHDIDALIHSIREFEKSNFEDLIHNILKRLTNFLPNPDTEIRLFAMEPELTSLAKLVFGIIGCVIGTGKMLIKIDPFGNWRSMLDYSIAHEYHHNTWVDLVYDESDEYNLLDALVYEGRADSFANLMYPGRDIPWTKAISPDQEKMLWESAQQDLEDTTWDTESRYLFGGSNIPRWTGYTIGFHIVQSFLKNNPDVDIMEWTVCNSREILENSGYDDSF